MKTFFLTIFYILCALLLSAQNATVPSPIIFIYDASGSMWGQLEGKTKMQIAGKVLSEALDDLPEQQPIGLVAYGHRRKKDCQDVEFLVSMDNADKEKVRLSLGNIKPLGRTPLAYSALQVIEQLKASKTKATIILLTDGIESCNGDLCEVIKQAKAEGIEFKLHIIGFGLKAADTEALKCATAAGEGQYYDAADASSLSIGIQEATTATIDTVQYIAPVKVQKTFSAFAIKNGEPIDAWVKVRTLDRQTDIGSVRTYADTGFVSIPPGKYAVTFNPLGGSDVLPITLEEVEIFADSIVHRTQAFDAGKISVTATKNGEGWDAMIAIYEPDSRKKVAGSRTYGRENTSEVNPGVYDVEVALLKVAGQAIQHRFEQVEVKPGELTKLSHDFRSGTLSVNIFNNQEKWDATVKVNAVSDGTRIAGGRTYTKGFTSEINPGVYTVKVTALKLNGPEVQHVWDSVVVKPSEPTTIQHNFQSGTLAIGAQGGGGWIDALVKVLDPQTGKNYGGGRVYASDESNAKAMTFNPGTYQVTVQAIKGAWKGQKKEFTVTVKAGERTEQMASF